MRKAPGFWHQDAAARVLLFLVLAPIMALSQTGGLVSAPAKPKPHVSFDGPALTFDMPDVLVGVAEYEEGPTGTTVLDFAKPVKAAVDVRGGGPGTINTDALRLAYDESFVNAIVLSGGSSYGLSAATGVANAFKDAITDPGSWQNVATVPGAIIFDLDDRRFNDVTPDDALGRAALNAARTGWCPLGARGAGRFAETGAYFGIQQHSGQGAAFRRSGETKVLVVTVINADGLVVDRNGQVLRCAQPVNGRCGSIAEMLSAHLASLVNSRQARVSSRKSQGLTANTTVTVVVTNRALPFWALQRLAVQVHTSMGRAIQPFSMSDDGDTLFAVTTGEAKGAEISDEDLGNLGVLASETAWDAILASLPVLAVATPHTDAVFSLPILDGITGRYAFAPDAIAELRRSGTTLVLELTGRTNDYLSAGQPVTLTPVAKDEFELTGPRQDRLHIDRDTGGGIVGITINPGLWPLHAVRK